MYNHDFFPEVALPEVTPQMQASMRTTRKKDLKKGRKKKSGSGGKGSKKGSSSKTKKDSKKRRILQKANSSVGKGEKKKPKKKGIAATVSVADEPKKTRKGKVPAMSKDHAQNRVVWGNSWMYEVLPNQVYGCSNCRCIWGGCKSCKKPGFRGKNAEYFREAQQDNASSTQVIEETGRTTKRSKRKVAKD